MIPNGPLGTLLKPEVRIEGEIPDEAKAYIKRFMDGGLGSIELMTGLEKIKRKMADSEILRP